MQASEEEKQSLKSELADSYQSEMDYDHLWKDMQKNHGYKVIKRLGEGSFGIVQQV